MTHHHPRHPDHHNDNVARDAGQAQVLSLIALVILFALCFAAAAYLKHQHVARPQVSIVPTSPQPAPTAPQPSPLVEAAPDPELPSIGELRPAITDEAPVISQLPSPVTDEAKPAASPQSTDVPPADAAPSLSGSPTLSRPHHRRPHRRHNRPRHRHSAGHARACYIAECFLLDAARVAGAIE